MPKINPYHIPKLPETATVSYYDAETDQNLTFEGWNQLNSTANPAEIRIINEGEVYHSWKANVDYPVYGPMDFGSQAGSLIVARSNSIISRLEKDHKTIVQLLNHNRSGTVELLKAEGVLAAFNVSHSFDVAFPKGHSESNTGPAAWKEYREEIEIYVEKLCKKWSDKWGNFDERLRQARKDLAEHIWKKYYDRLPCWPDVNQINAANIELDTGGAYEHSSWYIIWSCRGWVRIKDERPSRDSFKAEFSGNPDTKILQFDFEELKKLEKKINLLGIEDAKKMVDAKEGTRDPQLLTWADFK